MGAYQGFKYLFGRGSFNRPREGWRWRFGGMKTNSTPDSLPPGKYPIAVNVRGYRDNSVETRPGTGTPRFVTAGSPVTDLRNYVALNTDALPRTLARNTSDQIYLDDGTVVGTLAAGGLGASLIPFRPNQSPDPYMYIANAADYQKFSAPDPAVVATKVGIAEPQTACEAAQIAQTFTEVLSPGGNWNTGGTASAWTSGDRSTDIVVFAIEDPVSPFKEGSTHGATPPRWAIQVSPTVQYQRGEIVMFNGSTPLTTIVEEVIAPLSISMTVQAIYLNTGPGATTVLTLQGITSPGKTKPQDNESGVILNNIDVIAQLVRGAIIQVGSQKTFVQSVTSGPDNQICVECLLDNTHVAGEIVTGLPTIIVNDVQNAASIVPGTPIIGDMGNVETFSVAAGIGTLTTGPPGGGPTGTIIALPTTLLNGWGPNAHVGAYEMGTAQNFGWGLDPSTTSGYNNPNNVADGNDTTYADATGQHTHTYYGCIWTFPVTASQSNMVLNINSRVLADGDDGLAVNYRSAGIWYSLDGGTTWNQIYNMGPILPAVQPLSRPQQWDSVPLPSSQIISNVQVMAFTDSHDDMVQRVYTINISSGAASIGIDTGAYQTDDYLHFSVNVSDPTQIAEIKLQFDVSDGTFLSNYYYYSVRPSDLVPVTGNTVTQLGAIQSIVSQTLTNQQAQADGLNISGASVAGASQWTEIWIPIAELTRIGGDQTKTLANINAVQWVVNALGTVTVSGSSIAFVGGGQPNIGIVGEPYRYRVRPRSSITGARGNPSPDMRYGISAVRQPVQINLPSASYDSQINFWDVFRIGGAITSWRFIGSIASNKTTFEDNYSDDAAEVGEVLEFDNFEPWPSVDVPLNATAAIIVGTEAEVTITGTTNALRYLPGNIVNLGGQNDYTLRNRPVLLANGNYLFTFDECTVGFNQGTISDNGQVTIYEPKLARQFLPYLWGPDVNGTVFAVGDPLRPGTIYTSKPSNPDSAPDTYNQELTNPSEPLLGGEVLDGLSFVGSTERWWALYPQLDNPLQRYNPVQQPMPRGLSAPRGHCTDGQQIFWWAKDGIWASKDGSLTDADLYNLFPHEGVGGVAVTYGPPPLGRTIQPPDYSRAGTFRLIYCNYYIYAIYQDSSGNYDMLVYDQLRKAWSVDVYPTPISAMYESEQPSGTIATAGTAYSELLMADIAGNIYQQTPFTNDNGNPIVCTIATNEFDGGDLRAPKQWGDYFLDALVSCAAGITLQPMSLGTIVGPTQILPNGAQRQRLPLGVNGVVISDFMGIFATWTDDFTTQSDVTRLHIWDISFQVQPATTINWTTFGSSFGLNGYGHIREIVIAYVSTTDLTFTITSYDGQSPPPITLPATGGAFHKVLFPVGPNKGQLFSFQCVSTAFSGGIAVAAAQPFQIFNEDMEVRIGGWDRQSKYQSAKVFSGDEVSAATI